MADIEIKRGYEVLPDNSVRFGIRVVNNSPAAILDVEVILDYPDSLFNLQDGRIQKLGNIPPAKERTVKFILKPLGCVHQEYIGATVQYNDHTYEEKHFLSMRRKEIHCVCPFLRAKSMSTAQFLELSLGGHSAEAGLNFEGVSVDQVLSFLMQTCTNRLYKVEERSVEGGKILYLSSESQGEKAYYLLTVLIKKDEGLTQVMLRAVSDKTHGLQGFLNEIVSELKHLVSTVKSAREIGVIRHEQVINIIDSVVQSSNFSVDGKSSGSGSVHVQDSVVQRSEIDSSSASVNIQDSVVQRSTIKADNERKEREERARREQEKLERKRRKEEEERKSLEAIRLKAAEEAEKKKKADEERRRREEEKKVQETTHVKVAEEVQSSLLIHAEKRKKKAEAERKRKEAAEPKRRKELQQAPKPTPPSKSSSSSKKPTSYSSQRQTLSTQKKSRKNKVLVPMFVLLLLGGILMGFTGDTDSSDTVSIQSSASSDNDQADVSTESTDEEDDSISAVFIYPEGFSRSYTNSIGMEFTLIPAGEFKMGSPSGEKDRDYDEGPVHKVTIGTAYYLGTYEVTQEQWVEVMGDNPSDFDGDSNPVEDVSWNDVNNFVDELNEMEGTDKYRLPSEAEWEYACRAGTTTRYSFGDSSSDLDDYAWWDGNSGGKTHPVGQKKPNPWGLYDMHGNVWEWCQDEWHATYKGAPTDGSAWEDGSSSYRVFRGGSWGSYAGYCRSANRDGRGPDDGYDGVGFRLLREM